MAEGGNQNTSNSLDYSDADIQVVGVEGQDIIFEDNSLILVEEEAEAENAALDSVDAHVEERYRQNAERLEQQKTKREVALAHSRYILENIPSSPKDRYEAKLAAAHWSKKHSVKIPDSKLPRHAGSNSQTRPRPSTSRLSDQTGSISQTRPTPSTSRLSDQSSTLKVEKTCPVLNCQAYFTDEALYLRHMNHGPHSPCNPIRDVENSRIYYDINSAFCPACGNIYKSEDECREHMAQEKHDILMSPMAVGGYACPQCLHISPQRQTVTAHMTTHKHNTFSYQMQDDTTVEPVMFPRKLVEAFIKRCRNVPWYVECLDCGIQVQTHHIHGHSLLQHHLMSFCDTSVSELFAAYLCGYTCVMCQRLFNKLPPEGFEALHKCDEEGKQLGMFVENDCKTFAEFVRRLSLNEFVVENEEEQSAAKKMSDLTPSEPQPERMEVQDEQTANSPTPSPPTKQQKLCSNRNLVSDPREIIPSGSSDKENMSRDSNGSLQSSGASKSSWRTPTKKRLSEEEDVVVCFKRKRKSSGSDNDIQIPCTGSECKGLVDMTEPITLSDSPVIAFRDPVKHVASSAQPVVILRNDKTKYHTSDSKDVMKSSLFCSDLPDDLNAYNMPPARPLTYKSPFDKPLGADIQDTEVSSGGKQSSTHQHVAHSSREIKGANKRISPRKSRWQDAPVGLPPPFPCHNTDGWAHLLPPPAPIPPPEKSESSAFVEREPENLEEYRLILFLDLDNWSGFFQRLPQDLKLPEKILVWGFYGGVQDWREPYRCPQFEHLKKCRGFHLHSKCGKTKDAADFALVMQVGRLHERLPKSIPFVVLSGDRGFVEVERQMSGSGRLSRVINPHHKDRDDVYTLIVSVMTT